VCADVNGEVHARLDTRLLAMFNLSVVTTARQAAMRLL
jgi:hypothetical protein